MPKNNLAKETIAKPLLPLNGSTLYKLNNNLNDTEENIDHSLRLWDTYSFKIFQKNDKLFLLKYYFYFTNYLGIWKNSNK